MGIFKSKQKRSDPCVNHGFNSKENFYCLKRPEKLETFLKPDDLMNSYILVTDKVSLITTKIENKKLKFVSTLGFKHHSLRFTLKRIDAAH